MEKPPRRTATILVAEFADTYEAKRWAEVKEMIDHLGSYPCHAILQLEYNQRLVMPVEYDPEQQPRHWRCSAHNAQTSWLLTDAAGNKALSVQAVLTAARVFFKSGRRSDSGRWYQASEALLKDVGRG